MQNMLGSTPKRRISLWSRPSRKETNQKLRCTCGSVKDKTSMVYENDILMCCNCALKKAKERVRS